MINEIMKLYTYKHLPRDNIKHNLDVQEVNSDKVLIIKEMEVDGMFGYPKLYIRKFKLYKDITLVTYTYSEITDSLLKNLKLQIIKSEMLRK